MIKKLLQRIKLINLKMKGSQMTKEISQVT